MTITDGDVEPIRQAEVKPPNYLIDWRDCGNLGNTLTLEMKDGFLLWPPAQEARVRIVAPLGGDIVRLRQRKTTAWKGHFPDATDLLNVLSQPVVMLIDPPAKIISVDVDLDPMMQQAFFAAIGYGLPEDPPVTAAFHVTGAAKRLTCSFPEERITKFMVAALSETGRHASFGLGPIVITLD